MTQITRDKVKAWLLASLVRALKTWAQSGIAYIGTSAVGVLDFDWIGFFSITCMSLVLSILTSIAGIPEVESGTPLHAIMGKVEGEHSCEE